MKILHVIWDSSLGGLENYVYQICCSSQLNIEFKSEVCVLHKRGIIADQLIARGIFVHFIDSAGPFDFKSFFRFIKLLKKENYKIISIHERSFIPNLIIKYCTKGKVVFFEHGGELIGKHLLKRIKRLIFYKLFSSSFDFIICNSEFVHQELNRLKFIDLHKSAVVTPGVDTELFSSNLKLKEAERNRLKIFHHEIKIVGVVARLVYLKGIDIFIRVAANILKNESHIYFVIVGDGPLRKRCEALAKKYSCENEIFFVGWREDIHSALNLFDIFLFTSRWESFGIVLCEAMSMGIPIVGFNIPGANKVIDNGVTGVLVKPFDVISASEAVLNLFADRELYCTLSASGIERARKNFSIENTMNKLRTIYMSISI